MLNKNYEYFLEIAEQKSLTKAAEKIFVSQPSLSKYLSRLEKSLGIELFDHSKSPLKLSYAGERYLEYIGKAISLEKQIAKEFDEIRSNERGSISLGIALWRGACLLPDILPSFYKKHPNFEIRLFEGSTEYMENLLAKDKVDFCIMNLPVNNKKMAYELVFNERILLAANKNDPLLQKLRLDKETAPEDNTDEKYRYFDITRLENEQIIFLRPEQQLAQTVSTLFSRHKMSPEKMFLTENLQTAINLVASGFGFTFVPEGGIRNAIPTESIRLFEIGKPALSWELAVVYNNSAYLTKAARAFIGHMKQVIPRNASLI